MSDKKMYGTVWHKSIAVQYKLSFEVPVYLKSPSKQVITLLMLEWSDYMTAELSL